MLVLSEGELADGPVASAAAKAMADKCAPGSEIRLDNSGSAATSTMDGPSQVL